MTTIITGSKDTLENPASASYVQYLPCSINYTGETQIKDRFSQFTSENVDKGSLSNSLRGFPLDGKTVRLPEGFTGLVVESSKAGLTKQDKSARVSASFKEMRVWNYDKVPGESDSWQQALNWTKVADVLHSD